MTREDAKRRIESQMPRRDKVGIMEEVWKKRSKGYIVSNDGAKEDLERHIANVLGKLQARRSNIWTWLMLVIPFLTVGRTAWVLAANWWTKRSYDKTKAQKSD